MNTGIISSRYATALFKYVKITGNGQKVYEQAIVLDKCFMQVDKLKDVIYNPKATTDELKLKLFVTALGGPKGAAPEMVSFLKLVMKNRRTKYLPIMLRAFMEEYRHAHNIHVGKLTVAVPNPELVAKLEERGRARTGGLYQIETEVDPSLIGGFIFEMEDQRLDASVSARLKSVKRQYVEKNRRII